jgi:hypothetical protein
LVIGSASGQLEGGRWSYLPRRHRHALSIRTLGNVRLAMYFRLSAAIGEQAVLAGQYLRADASCNLLDVAVAARIVLFQVSGGVLSVIESGC